MEFEEEDAPVSKRWRRRGAAPCSSATCRILLMMIGSRCFFVGRRGARRVGFWSMRPGRPIQMDEWTQDAFYQRFRPPSRLRSAPQSAPGAATMSGGRSSAAGQDLGCFSPKCDKFLEGPLDGRLVEPIQVPRLRVPHAVGRDHIRLVFRGPHEEGELRVQRFQVA